METKRGARGGAWRARGRRMAVTVAAVAMAALAGPAVAHGAFGLSMLDTDTHSPFAEGGTPASVHIDQAGAHADSTLEFDVNTKPDPFNPSLQIPDGALKNVIVDLPPGFMGDPQAVPRCSAAQFNDINPPTYGCDAATQVGVANTLMMNESGARARWMAPVYNLVPSKGEVAAFGFFVVKVPIKVSIEVRSDGDYGVRANVRYANRGALVLSQKMTLWAVPADPIHDHERFNYGNGMDVDWPLPGAIGASSGLPRRPFLSLPPTCPGPLATRMSIQQWGSFDWLHYDDYTDNPTTGIATGPVGCERVPFAASLEMKPDTTRAAEPAGFTATVRTDYDDNPDGIANAHVKDVSMTLPEGVTIAPGGADGLDGCTAEQLGVGSKAEPTCPQASKIGDVRIETPVLDEDVTGEVYLRAPTPERLFGIAIVARANGVIVKLPGEVDPDPRTGQLTTTFRNNPQLPFEKMTVTLKGGPRSPLVNPPTCGVKTTTTKITSWAGHSVVSTDRFTVDRAADGGACGPQAFEPGLEAGSESARAGASSAFSLVVSRPAGHQDLSTLTATMPEGLLADISSAARCPDAQADAGSCGEDSRIGRVEVGVGEGTRPLWLPQPGKAQPRVHLAGPYRGAPYSLSVVVPAQAGPFDLGRAVVRVPLHVDRRTAQVSAPVAQSRVYDRHGNLDEVVEGAMPTIVEGVVIDQREIRVIVDRPGFMLNPTSCAAKQVGVKLGSVEGQVRDLASRFQVGDCQALPFKPKLSLALTGRKQRTTGKHPGVKAVVKQTGIGEAGIRRAKVTLPPSLALDPDNAQALCEFVDGTKPDLENHCPKGSIVGRARAKTPLLDSDLVGDVYFVKNIRIDPKTGNQIRTLPMIVVALRGEIAINLVGESDTTRNGRLVNTFNGVPDAPITQFNLNIKGGKNGILAVTGNRRGNINLCAKPRGHIAVNRMNGQNGKQANYRIRVKTPCGKAGKAKVGKRKAAVKKRA